MSYQGLIRALVDNKSLEEENETHAVVELAFFNQDYFFYQFVQVCKLWDQAGWFYQVWYNGDTLIAELGNSDDYTVTPFSVASEVVERHICKVIEHMEEHHEII